MNSHLRPHLLHFLYLRLQSRFFAALCLFFVASQQVALAEIDFGNYALSAQNTSATVVQTEQIRAELLAHAPQGLGAGKPMWLGLALQHQPHWHTYWKNPGDSGLATVLQWTLPAGVQAGEVQWPLPQKISIGTLANFGYEGAVLLPVPLTLGPDFAPAPGQKTLDITLNASWLVCRQECIPQEGRFSIQLPLQGALALHTPLFDAAQQSIPTEHAGTTRMQISPEGLLLSVAGLPPSWHGKALNAFTEVPELTVHAMASGNTEQRWNKGVWSATLPLSEQRSASPAVVPVVVSLGNSGLRVSPRVEGTWPAAAVSTALSPALQAALEANKTAAPIVASAGSSLLLALASALLGGLILNLMPCVFPVLAIKVLGFAAHPSHSRTQQRLQGWAYTAGVVLSFMALGGLLWALRAGGEQLGWGFQLQSPLVVSGLALLFTLLGLNLMGLLEVGSLLPSRWATLQWRHPLGDAFLSGVLAVAIASPCTAPFMGASLGYALTVPGPQALAIFAALGVGLALPYLAASHFPAIGRMLPRPGAWMETLRRFMAFPMWATVVWLVWVLGHISGVDGAASLLALLLGMALLVWSLQLPGRSRWVYGMLATLVCLGLAGTVGRNAVQSPDSDANTPDQATTWQAWAPGRVESELLTGRAVFVDFTAAWCITCQYNKKTTLANAAVLGDFAAKRVTLLRADWTRRDPAITQALKELGRSGVPVYVLYQSGRSPVVFSEILGVQELRDALQAL